jgi:sugar phosphate isomerase/epimerase
MHSVSRREFLGKTVSTAFLAACGSASVSSLLAAAKPKHLPIVVFTKVYQPLNLDFEKAAALTAAAGLKGVDSPIRPKGEILPEKVADDLPRYAEVLQKHQLSIPLLTTAILSPSSPSAEQLLRVAKKSGVQFYRLGFVDRHSDQSVKQQIAETRAKLKDLAAMNKEIGIGGIFQNHSPAGHAYLGGDLNDMLEILAGFDPDQIGAAFDIGHALKVHGDGWRGLFDKLKPHLKIAYVKDVDKQGAWVPFGRGEVGKVGYFKMLHEIGYHAPISMHIEFDWSNKGKNQTEEALLKALKESAATLRGWLERI